LRVDESSYEGNPNYRFANSAVMVNGIFYDTKKEAKIFLASAKIF